MPIEQLSDQRRLSRDFKVRLGERKVKRTREVATRDTPMVDSYPTETDYFVLEGAPADVKAAYKGQPKSLRIMLPMEWDARTPDGDELVFSLFNRAYGRSHGLKCKGTGRSAEFPGTARTSDENYAISIEKATGHGMAPQRSRSGATFYSVRCWGRDCPKFYHVVSQPDPEDPSKMRDALAPDHDKDASCKAVGILRCFLLDPSVDQFDTENYCKVLGVMELATSSVNSIIDLQSGFDLLRAYTGGRTAGIPLTLVRKPTTTFKPFRQTHFTLALHYDQREAQRWAAIALPEVFLSEDQRARLKHLQATPLGLTVDSVRDLIPERLLPASDDDLHGIVGEMHPGVGESPATDGETATGPGTPERAPEPATDRSGPPTAAEAAATPFLVSAQLDELKRLAGGLEDPTQPFDQISNPWRKEALDRLGAAITAMRTELGISEPLRLSELRIGHGEWLKERLRSLPDLKENPS